MSALSVAAAHARQRTALAASLRREAKRAWAQVDRSAIVESWARLMPALLAALVAGQRAAASSADSYLTDMLAEQDVTQSPAGLVNASALAGVASDGRDLASLLARPPIVALSAIGAGQSVPRAMAAGGFLLELAVHTQVADAGRVADGVALTARHHMGGYTRMIVGATCSRCIMLAGRWYRWNAEFDRHPKCDCIGIPCQEDVADDFRTDPRRAFNAMSLSEQDKVFTKAGAQAIRDGADMNQVVNARRGAAGLAPAGARVTAQEAQLLRGGRQVGRLQTTTVFGHDLFVTTEGTSTRGLAGRRLGARDAAARPARLMPESIYQISAGDRDEAIRLLKRFGYIR